MALNSPKHLPPFADAGSEKVRRVQKCAMSVTIRTYTTDFIYTCTDTGVIMTHAFIFLLASATIVFLTHAQLAVVTQSCTLLYITAHCDLLLQ